MLLLILVSTMFTTSLAADTRGNLLMGFLRGFTKEVVAVKQPLLETAVSAGDTQCANLKRFFGLEYDQLEAAEKEPDLDQLSVKYITPFLNLSININDVAKLLPKSPTFNQEHLVIYAHGFTSSPSKSPFKNISKAFIDRGMYNILALDGSSLIQSQYLRSTTYVRFIGQKLGSVLAQLVKDGLPTKSIHIIGHSLGAHIAGFTGKQFTELTGLKVARITGLDPARLCFGRLEPSLKLTATDADFVDVIHTNGGVAGLKEPVGQVDYYPNAGDQQPGCLWDKCSHRRAWLYFTASLLDEKAFPAVRCADWNAFKQGRCDDEVSYMGIASEPGLNGTFYLQTSDQWPYGIGMEGTEYQNTEGVLKTIQAMLH